MIPARQAKVDLSERKYFDSGDYAMRKAGKSEQEVGNVIPSPQSIHHHSIAAEEAEQQGAAGGVEGEKKEGSSVSTGAGLPVNVNEHQITSPLSIVPPISASPKESHQAPAITSDVAGPAVLPGVVAANNNNSAGNPRPPNAHPRINRRPSTNCTIRPQITRRPSADGGDC
ncbi:hypothetical protein J3B02_000216 [Coemansia erecta]|nr:hypothetical protein J3B02_000216 [Coemansia erecta]